MQNIQALHHSGLMTSHQSTLLRQKRNEIFFRSLLLASILAVFTYGAVLQAQATDSGILYVVALGIFVTTIFTGMEVVDLLLAIQQDLALHKIAKAQGKITAQTTYLYDVLSGQQTIAIGDKKYKIVRKLAPVNAGTCHVSYAPNSRIVLTVEA